MKPNSGTATDGSSTPKPQLGKKSFVNKDYGTRRIAKVETNQFL